MATDIVGREIFLDKWVAYGQGQNLHIGKVSKITPKMVRISTLQKSVQESVLRRHADVFVLKDTDVTFYLLTS
jgi:hypothetical protein